MQPASYMHTKLNANFMAAYAKALCSNVITFPGTEQMGMGQKSNSQQSRGLSELLLQPVQQALVLP